MPSVNQGSAYLPPSALIYYFLYKCWTVDVKNQAGLGGTSCTTDTSLCTSARLQTCGKPGWHGSHFFSMLIYTSCTRGIDCRHVENQAGIGITFSILTYTSCARVMLLTCSKPGWCLCHFCYTDIISYYILLLVHGT